MFSSTNPINPLLYLSPSNFPLSSPFLPQIDNNNISLPQQNNEILPNPKKKTKRRDRHSKIYTAHGLRDRRVRLSIEISHEFFKLQDILGFDKASETISWLLKSSESSINELKKKQGLEKDGFKNISTISELCEGENFLLKSTEKKINSQSRASFYGLIRRESRARARERARERTREKKILTQKIDEYLIHSISGSSNLVSEIEGCEEIVDDVINGSTSINPKFENLLTSTQKDWDKILFADYEMFSECFEGCNY